MAKEIPLTKGQVVLVDDEDYEWLNQYKWFVVSMDSKNMYGKPRYYAARWKNRKRVYMHREILVDAPEVDHRDNNPLNNQRANLRECTHKQNMRNRTGCGFNSSYKGVYLDTNTSKCWKAQI